MRLVAENVSLMKINNYSRSIILLLLVIPIFITEVNAQYDIPIGDWRMHISYRQVSDLTISENEIYCSSSNGIFYYSKEDNSINTITKLDGLSDTDITEINYSNENNLLIIGYKNGNLDFLSNSEIKNFPTIKDSNFQSKSINHSILSVNTSYISTDFGVLIFDMNKIDIKESYLNLGENGEILQINYAAIYHDSLFLATREGVIAGSLDPAINLQDFNNWYRFNAINGIPEVEINSLAVYQNTLFTAISNDGIYKYTNGSWLKENGLQDIIINNISAGPTWMTVSSDSSIWKFEDNVFVEITSGSIAPQMALYDSGNSLWIADNAQGLRTDFDGNFITIKPSGPNSDDFFKIFYKNNQIIGLSGGYDETGTRFNNLSGFYTFTNGSWNNYSIQDIELPSDLVDIDYDAVNKEYIITSFSDGYVEWNGSDLLKWVDQTNQDYPFTSNKLAAVHFSNELWISAYGSQPSVYSRDESGSWLPVGLNQPGDTQIIQIISDQAGNIWFRVDPNTSGGIIVYNQDPQTSKYLSNGSGNGGLPSNQVNDLELDLEGNVWVATDQGAAYYFNGSVQSGQTSDAVRPIFEGRFLFNNEKVNTISVDGGNRKWMGTDNGLWLFNESGEELISHFTAENSPLLSNSVTAIEINTISGEVFIATDLGACSFRSDATSGDSKHAPEIKVFPNPITTDFNGIVGFEGLATDALVKITDVSGRLVWQMQANGSTASWNLSTIYGGRPSSGIYLIFSSTTDGADTFVGKLAIIE